MITHGLRRVLGAAAVLSVAGIVGLATSIPLAGQQGGAPAPAAQKIDAEYTKRIIDNTPDKRILTELIDHMPASDTVPSPLKFLGYVPGENNRITYHKDIVAYYQALDKASDRVTMWEIGKSEEGRPAVALAIADEATIKAPGKYKQITAQLTDVDPADVAIGMRVEMVTRKLREEGEEGQIIYGYKFRPFLRPEQA